MADTTRRYDIDWLRVIAIGLLIIYHISITFQPWGIFIGFIQNSDPLPEIWPAMAMLNVWRIPLLFFVSGMGVCFAQSGSRDWSLLSCSEGNHSTVIQSCIKAEVRGTIQVS